MTATREASADLAEETFTDGPLADVARPQRRRTLWSDLRGALGTPARRVRLIVVLGLLALAVAAPLAARAGLADARTAADAMEAERAGASGLRAEVDAAEMVSAGRASRAAARAADARAAHNDQRHRLAALGLNESTVGAFLAQALANTELVEYQRDRTTAAVDRQASEIPQMESCLVAARQAINRAFNTIFDPNLIVPGPTDLCRALLGA